MKRIITAAAGAAMCLAMVGYAQDTMGSQPSGKPETEQGAKYGGKSSKSGAEAQMPGAQNQLTATVVEAKGKELFVEHQGVVIPLKVEKDTKIEGMTGKKLSDLKPGDEVQVSFMVKNRTENIALDISKSSGMGGAGTGGSSTSGSSPGGSMGEDQGVGGSQQQPKPEEQMPKPEDQSNQPSQEPQKPIY